MGIECRQLRAETVGRTRIKTMVAGMVPSHDAVGWWMCGLRGCPGICEVDMEYTYQNPRLG